MSWDDSAWPYAIALLVVMLVVIFWPVKRAPYPWMPTQPIAKKKVVEDEYGVHFEDFDIDYNEVKFSFEAPKFCEGKHHFTLDSVHMAKNPDEDDLYFSCKNIVEVWTTDSLGGDVREEWVCSGKRIIERKEFWTGIKKPQEQYVDPEWEQNYAAHIYNQNMRAFESAMAFPMLITPTPTEVVFWNDEPACGHTGPFGLRCNRKPNHEYGDDYKKGMDDKTHAYAGSFWDNEGNVLKR